MNITEAVRDLRARLGMSQQAFANLHGMSLNAIARCEAGRAPTPIVRLQLMRTALKEGHDDLAAAFSASMETPELSDMVQALFSTARPSNPLPFPERVEVETRLRKIWALAGKPKLTKADLQQIREWSSEAHQILEGMRIEHIPGDWKK